MTTVRFELHLAGAPCVIDAQGKRWALEGRSAAVMAYVVLDPAPSRERLAALLWPDSDDPRRNLRQQLLRLKQAVGGAVLVEGDSTLRLADGVALSDGDAASMPLLAELRFADCPDFDAWLELQRRQRRERAAAALHADIAQAEASGRYDEALMLAQGLVTLDPLAEAHHRLVMRMHYLRGDRAAGLAAYDALVKLLRVQLGLEPDALTQALARSLRETGHAALAMLPRAPARAVPATVLRPPRMIGRDDALGALRAAWQDGRAALVLGEPGMGKSRLLAEAAAGVNATWVAGRPGDAGVPYVTLARLLRRLRERHEPVFTAAQAAVVACVLPEWATSANPAAPSGDLRLALHGAVQAWLSQAQRQGLALVIFDDLHFADAASIEAARSLIGGDASMNLRFVLAARPGEIGAEGEALRSALTEARALDEIALEPLNLEQTTALVTSLGLPELDAEALGPQLARHSGGNPLYALETLKLGLADGSLREGRLPTPQGVGVLIERRLKQLTSPALALARVAAVAGVDFDIDLAEAVTGRNAVDLADAWSQLDAAQVLRDGAFAHDLVHDAALRTIPKPVAQRLHEQCATHLAARGGEPARLAAHWLAAGRALEGGEAFLEAAARARSTGRRVEEAAFLAAAAQGFADAGDAERRFDALAERSSVLVQADFGEAADQALAELHALAADDRQRLRVLREQIELLAQRGQYAESVELGGEALALARRLEDPTSQLRIVGSMVGGLNSLGRDAEAYDLLLPLGRWARDHAAADLRYLWRGYWAVALANLDRLRESVQAYEDAIDDALANGLPAAVNLINIAVIHDRMGRTEQAVQTGRRAMKVLREDPHAKGQPLLTMLTLAHHLEKNARYAEALALFDEVLGPIKAGNARAWAVLGQTWLATLWLHLGQHARAAALLADNVDDVPPLVRARRLIVRARLAHACERPGARALVDEAVALMPGETGHALATRITGAWFAPAADILRDVPRWLDLARRSERFGLLLVGQLAVANAAIEHGEHDRATKAVREARALLDEGIGPETITHGEAWLRIGQTLRAVGDAVEGDTALHAGMQWVQRHAVPHVPPEFLDSFLNRNPHHCALLRAGRLLGGGEGDGRLVLE